MKKLNTKGFTAVEVIVIVLSLCVLGFIGYYVWNQQSESKKVDAISSFAECKADKGSVIQESYPEVCVTKKGKRFTNPDQKVEPQDDKTTKEDVPNIKAADRPKYIDGYDKATTSLKAYLISDDVFYRNAEECVLQAGTPESGIDGKTYIGVVKVVRDSYATIQYCASGATTILAKSGSTWKQVGSLAMGHPACSIADKYKISKEIDSQCYKDNTTETRPVTYP